MIGLHEFRQVIAALRFYENQANWRTLSTGFAAQYDPDPSPVQLDHGKRARDALALAIPDDFPVEWLGCRLPPKGWYCSRPPGHPGPCPARPCACVPGRVCGLHSSHQQESHDERHE